MTETTPTEDFMRAEEAAQKLAQSLKRLDAEAESYATAGKTLEQVSTEVRELANKTSLVAERSAEAIEAIRGVGSVQILERVESLSTGADATAQAVDAMGVKIDEMERQVGSFGPQLESVQSDLARLLEVVQSSSAAATAALADTAKAAKVDADAIATLARNATYAAVAATIVAAIGAILTRF